MEYQFVVGQDTHLLSKKPTFYSISPLHFKYIYVLLNPTILSILNNSLH